MNIKFTNDISTIEPSQLKGFFVGWPNKPDAEKHYKLLENSQEIWLAIDEQTSDVVGFINAITDKTLSAYIPLLEVLPSHQQHGIGKQLVALMADSLEHYYMIDLSCDEAMKGFYTKYGFKDGNLMFKRNYKYQSGH